MSTDRVTQGNKGDQRAENSRGARSGRPGVPASTRSSRVVRRFPAQVATTEDPMLKYSHPTRALIHDYWPITILAPAILVLIATSR